MMGGMGQGSMGGHGSMMGMGMGGVGGHARSGFAPDVYGGRAPGPAMSTISSHSWAPESNMSMSAPRRTSHPALVPSMAESTIAPRGVSQQRGQAIDPRHQLDIPPPHSGHSYSHGHGHQRERLAHRHSHHQSSRGDGDDWDDSKSDASYYARPKHARARSSSVMSDTTTSTSITVRPSTPHRTSHHRGSPGQHDHSPISPSPLTRTREAPHSYNHQAPSPLSPRAHSSVRHGRKISGFAGDGGGGAGRGGGTPPLPSPYKKVTPLAPESDYSAQEPSPRALREGSERGNRRNSISHGSVDEYPYTHGRRRLASPQGYTSDDEGRYSSRSHSGRRDKSGHRQEDAGNQSVHSSSARRPGQSQGKHVAEAYPDDERHGRPHDHDHHHHRDHEEREQGQGQGHSYSRSLSRVPPPLPYRAPSPAQAATLQIPRKQHLMPDIGGLSLSGESQGTSRRRAHSMQMQNQYPEGGLPISSSASLAGFGGASGNAGVGGPGYASGPYQTPSMVGGGDAYDDGASVAGSAMTFMDGPVAGRTSHYGLPKYPHQAKPDYRRCVPIPISHF